MIGSLHFIFSLNLICRRLLHDRQPAFLFQLEEIASQATLFVSNLFNQILLFSLVTDSVFGLFYCVFHGLIFCVSWINILCFGLFYSVFHGLIFCVIWINILCFGLLLILCFKE